MSKCGFHKRIKASIDESAMIRTYRRMALRRQGFMCFYCRCPLTFGDETGDHVTPRSNGGKVVFENIVAACSHCNNVKADMDPRLFLWIITAPLEVARIERLRPASRSIDILLIHATRRIWTRAHQAMARIDAAMGLPTEIRFQDRPPLLTAAKEMKNANG